MPGTDNISIEILADGTLKVTTDEVSGPNHMNAEQLLKYLGELAGGKTTRQRRGHHHHHEHEHEKAKH